MHHVNEFEQKLVAFCESKYLYYFMNFLKMSELFFHFNDKLYIF